jgi:hypothetical protein
METNYAQLTVVGITNVTYTIESSSTLTNWAPVYTNVGGPFLWSEPIAPEPRFYRVQITGN